MAAANVLSAARASRNSTAFGLGSCTFRTHEGIIPTGDNRLFFGGSQCGTRARVVVAAFIWISGRGRRRTR
jgi:hypothetical protein